jgi:hypothetical protein
MRPAFIRLSLAIVLCSVTSLMPAGAAGVFECRSAGGSVTYASEPCAGRVSAPLSIDRAGGPKVDRRSPPDPPFAVARDPFGRAVDAPAAGARPARPGVLADPLTGRVLAPSGERAIDPMDGTTWLPLERAYVDPLTGRVIPRP